MISADTLVATLLGVAILVAICTAVLSWLRIPQPWAPAVAILRGAAQLAVIGLILASLIADIRWIALALLVMFTVATSVAARRLGWSRENLLTVATAIAAGVGTALLVVFATGALTPAPRYLLAVAAIVIGNAMSIATLAGRMFITTTVDHWSEVEGWLALGANGRQATLLHARSSVRDAILPTVDQTKSTGLVVLPGAFVGAIFGGLSPVEAGRFQIVVLAAILAAGTITASIVVYRAGSITVRPRPVT